MTRRAHAAIPIVLLGTMSLVFAQGEPTAKTKLPPTKEQMRTQAEQGHLDAEAAYKHVVAVKERANREKDVIKLTCVNDKVVQLKAQMNILDTSRADLAGSLGGTDDAASQGNFTKVTDAVAAIRLLREGADACMGETELSKQEAGVDVDRPNIPDDPNGVDPYGTDPTVSVDPPNYASAFH